MRYGRLLDHAHQTEQKIFSANMSLFLTGSQHSFFSLAPFIIFFLFSSNGLFSLPIPLPPLRTNHLAVGHLIQRDPPHIATPVG